MTPDDPEQRLAAALRAHASGLGTGFPAGSSPAPGPASPAPGPPAPLLSGHRTAQARPTRPAWAVLALAALLGAMAGVLAGVISAWPG